MAPQFRPVHPLRIVTQKIANTSIERLPPTLPHLTRLLLSCGDYLKGAASKKHGKDGSDTGVLLHKYKTQLSTLLQDKSAAGRWCAVVLVKATVEAGGPDIVQESGPWVRALLGYLVKKDKDLPTTKKAAITTLVRIFLLTRGNPAVMREITTPSISPFVTNCLNCVSNASKELGQVPRSVARQSPLLKIVLQAFITLIPHQPASFRPFLAQIRSVLSALIAPTPSNLPLSESLDWHPSYPSRTVTGLAQKLLALLPHSAPRNTSAEEWSKAVQGTIVHAHGTADHIFRAMIEERSRPTAFGNLSTSVKDSSEVLSGSVDDVFFLPAWRGIDAGSERLIGCLHILQAHIATTTPTTVSLPIGAIWGLTERILSVFDPSSQPSSGGGLRSAINPEIERDEREGLWSRLPEIHEASIDTLLTLVQRMRHCSVSLGDEIFERLAWIFQKDQAHVAVRLSTYRLISQLLHFVGPSISKEKVKIIRDILHVACTDVLPPETDGVAEAEAGNGKDVSNTLGQGALLQSKPVKVEEKLSPRGPLFSAASSLLCVALSRIGAETLPNQLRTLIDRTIILTQNAEAMTASVLNPPNNSSNDASIIPFLARAFPASPATEAILRPRLPVIKTRARNDIPEEDEESEYGMGFDKRPSADIWNDTEQERLMGEPPLQTEKAVATSEPQTSLPEMSQDPIVVRTPIGESPQTREIMSPKRARAFDSPGHAQSSTNADIPAPKRLREVEPAESPHLELPETSEASGSRKIPWLDRQLHAELDATANPVYEYSKSARRDASGSDSGSDIPPLIIDWDTDPDDEVEDENEDEDEDREGEEKENEMNVD